MNEKPYSNVKNWFSCLNNMQLHSVDYYDVHNIEEQLFADWMLENQIWYPSDCVNSLFWETHIYLSLGKERYCELCGDWEEELVDKEPTFDLGRGNN